MHLKNREGQSRQEIATALPNAIQTALQSYNDFIAREKVGSVKAFKDHHDACKVAIAHLELLLKLADWAGTGTDKDLQQHDLASMIEAAQAEVNKSKGRDNG